jgi:hypothetical protein
MPREVLHRFHRARSRRNPSGTGLGKPEQTFPGLHSLPARGTLLLIAAGFAGCGGVNVATESSVPVPLVDPMPVTVGIYYSPEFSQAKHDEERWGTDWKVDLGPYHVHMADKLFAAEFRETVPVADIKSLPANPSYKAIIEPRIEQFSFITPRDTGAKYFAVTIRYRLNVYAPDGALADSLTFTGYGSNGAGSGMTSTKPMVAATKAAMRDAAAKFLVQFPEQDVAKRLLAGEPLVEAQQQVALGAPAAGGQPASSTDSVNVDTVPIVDPKSETGQAPVSGGANASGASAPASAPAPSGDKPSADTGSSTSPASTNSSTPPGDASGAPAPRSDDPAASASPAETPQPPH